MQSKNFDTLQPLAPKLQNVLLKLLSFATISLSPSYAFCSKENMHLLFRHYSNTSEWKPILRFKFANCNCCRANNSHSGNILIGTVPKMLYAKDILSVFYSGRLVGHKWLVVLRDCVSSYAKFGPTLAKPIKLALQSPKILRAILAPIWFHRAWGKFYAASWSADSMQIKAEIARQRVNRNWQKGMNGKRDRRVLTWEQSIHRKIVSQRIWGANRFCLLQGN